MSPLFHNLIRALTILAGILMVLALVVVVGDIAFILLLRANESHNAWYFPVSFFALPILLASTLIFFVGRRLTRHSTRPE